MASRVGWRDLRPGLIGIALVALATWAVLVFGRVGAVRGETIEIYAATESGAGIVPGSSVWIAGHEVGRVRGVSFAPPSTDSLHRVVFALEVRRDASWALRRDATLQIRPGGSPIAAPVAYIHPGTVATPPLVAGDTIGAHAAGEYEERREGVRAMGRLVPRLLDESRALATDARTGLRLVNEREASVERAVVAARRTARGVAALRERVTEGGAARSRTRTLDRAGTLRARLDTLRRLVAHDEGTVGRLRGDSALRRRIARVRAEGSRLATLLSTPEGTIGRLRVDPGLARERERLELEIEALLRDLRRRPLRYVDGVEW